MNIYAQAGDKVTYLGENGYDAERDAIKRAGIKAGDILTVESTSVGSWSTYVTFEEIWGSHNSVMFEDVE